MGREIRMVPPNWEHPKKQNVIRFSPQEGLHYCEEYQPMYDQRYEEASAEWIEAFIKWHVAKEYDDCADAENRKLPYWDWDGPPPDKEYYRPWKNEDATWFQLWETVSEGTPVSPPFATKEELVTYLADHGDFWDEKRLRPGWGYERAKAFCDSGWAPTLIMQDGRVYEGTEIIPTMERHSEEQRPMKDG